MHVEWSPARFAAALAQTLDATGLTQGGIARIAGVNRSQASRWMRGENKPAYDNIRRLAIELRRRELAELADELMAAAGYEPLPEGAEAADPAAIIADDDWEASVLSDPDLPDRIKRRIILDSRQARAAYPGPGRSAPAAHRTPDQPDQAAG